MPSTARTSPELADALRRAELWPGGAEPVLVRETHASTVLLTGDRAWKVRKPVRFAFLDYRDLAARHAAALEEVRVNAELAPGTYLGVRPIVRAGEGFAVGEAGAEPPGTVEYVVEMRRFDERDTLAERLRAGRVPEGRLAELGAVLARFHAHATVAGGPPGGAAKALARLHRNMEDLVDLRGPEVPAAGPAVVARALEAAVLRDAGVHDARARAGLRRDGHGDLRADHVVLDAEGLRIVDRLEFSRELRCDDVAADLAFLLADLEAHGGAWAARTVLDAYRAAGGDAGDDRLLAFWMGYRALVSAKVAWLRAGQGGPDGARGAARLALAHRCAWRTRLPL
ncbi:MAG: hypothetical protein HZB46_11870, partial [Solirubrobacterales bacterium]|nr:hypothetical protein [Solirubrobacterales bacterium]